MSKQQVKDRLQYLINTKSPLVDLTKLCKTNNIFNIYALKNNVSLEKSIDYYFNVRKLKNAPDKLLHCLNLTINDIFPENVFAPTIFNVFGCPLSTDIDVAVVVKNIIDISFLRLENIYKSLEELGYDTSREIDFVQIVLDERGDFSSSNKGSKETQNMIYYTFRNHKQAYPCIFEKPADIIEPIDKVRTISKYVLDKLEDIIDKETYKNTRDIKKQIYTNIVKRIDFTNGLLKSFEIVELNSFVKALNVKIFQTLIITDYPESIPEIYKKIELGKLFSTKYGFDENICLALLTRGKLGNPDLVLVNDTFQNIMDLFISKSKEIIDEFLDFENVIEMNYIANESYGFDLLLSEFYKSPLVPTDIFISTMESLTPERKLNKLYILTSNYEEVKEYLDEDFVLKHCDLSDQRSDEWIEKLDYYLCGKNNGVPIFTGTTFAEWVTQYYNLCRGSSAEILMTKCCDFSKALGLNLIKFTCGFLVESKDYGAKGIAPDLLLIDKNTKKIIPVEFKCIVGKMEYSKNLSREIKLAKLQLLSCKNILENNYYGFSLIVLMFIYEKDDKFVYEIRYSKV